MKGYQNIQALPESPEKDFEIWWWREGSGWRPNDKEDCEEFCHHVAKIAWLNVYFNGRNK